MTTKGWRTVQYHPNGPEREPLKDLHCPFDDAAGL